MVGDGKAFIVGIVLRLVCLFFFKQWFPILPSDRATLFVRVLPQLAQSRENPRRPRRRTRRWKARLRDPTGGSKTSPRGTPSLAGAPGSAVTQTPAPGAPLRRLVQLPPPAGAPSSKTIKNIKTNEEGQ